MLLRSGMAESNLKEKIGTIRALVQLSLPYKKRFILIALLAFLGTGADLLQPLIYRVAINDVAGLFFAKPRPAGTQPDNTQNTNQPTATHPTPPTKPLQKTP